MKNIILSLLITFSLNFAKAQNVNIPDAKFLEILITNGIDLNNDGQIQVSEAESVDSLVVNGMNSLEGINTFKNLKYLECKSYRPSTLDLSGLVNLTYLNCRQSRLITLDVSGLLNLEYLVCSFMPLTSLNVSGLKNLEYLDCSINQLTTLDVSELVNLKYLNCEANEFTTLDLSSLVNLESLVIGNDQLSTLDVKALVNLESLNVGDCQLSTFDVKGLVNLKELYFAGGQFTTLDISSLVNLKMLSFGYSQLSTLDVSGLANLISLECFNNMLLTTLDLSGCVNLVYINCFDNLLSTSLNLSGCINLHELHINGNELPTLDLSGCVNMGYLYCENGKLTTLKVNGLANLHELNCSFNQLTTLDVGGCDILEELNCSGNLLQTLYLSNSNHIYGWPIYYDFVRFEFQNPTLRFICVDEDYYETMNRFLEYYGYTDVTVSIFCSGTNDGAYYSLSGNTYYDANNNGCTNQDSILPNLKLKIENDNNQSSYLISDAQGIYSITLPTDTFIITPIFYNDYFVCSPSSATVILPDTVLPNFCITPNGIKNDISVSIVPLRAARPGSADATYKIVYTNKGNTPQSGSLNFQYDDQRVDFIAASNSPTINISGLLTFDFNDLLIFESREIIVTMRTNSPADTPPVNVGDVIKFNATIVGNADDADTTDNMFALNQMVVGSIDPNDKTCLQGDIVRPEFVGQYVDYLIRFENTGTAPAENIVVTDFLDLSKFDISSLQVTSASHRCRTTISNGNKVQFIFDNIQLPFTEPLKHGYVVFKIKTLNTLIVGDSLKNKADIFFDFNLPVTTNIAASIIQTPTPIRNSFLSTLLSCYPNPNKGSFDMFFERKGNFELTVNLIDITGKIIYSNQLWHNDNTRLQFSQANLATGIYYLQLSNATDNWSKKIVVCN
jgi:hypothetical protein